jgi:hypothetical protein
MAVRSDPRWAAKNLAAPIARAMELVRKTMLLLLGKRMRPRMIGRLSFGTSSDLPDLIGLVWHDLGCHFEPGDTMNIVSKVRARTAIAALLLLSGAASTRADSPAPEHALSKETREKMAALHEQMAACLRSEKSLLECRGAMMRSCQEQLGSDGCPMILGIGGGTDGRHHMQPMSATPKPADR